MESRNMSEKEFQEFQKLLQRELGSAEPAKEDEEIAEMLRRDNRPARTVPPRYRQPAEPETEPVQEPEPEMEPETEAEPEMEPEMEPEAELEMELEAEPEMEPEAVIPILLQ